METIIYGLLVMVINAAILFYVVRKATKANEQIELLRELVLAIRPKEVEVKSDIALLTEERKERDAMIESINEQRVAFYEVNKKSSRGSF